MEDLRNDPEYEIRWPSDILAAELDRLIAYGRADKLDALWQDEVETVLRQAFTSLVPQREFQEQWNQSSRKLNYDEEPF
jgi:hypothetical protein